MGLFRRGLSHAARTHAACAAMVRAGWRFWLSPRKDLDFPLSTRGQNSPSAKPGLRLLDKQQTFHPGLSRNPTWPDSTSALGGII